MWFTQGVNLLTWLTFLWTCGTSFALISTGSAWRDYIPEEGVDMANEVDKTSTRLSLASVVKLVDNLISAPVDGEVVILSVESGSYFGLDEIGSEIWRQLETPTRVDLLCDSLATKYAADRLTIEHDVIALLESLVAEGLVSVHA
jgi:hypothetical protein